MTGWLAIALLAATTAAAILVFAQDRKLVWQPILATIMLGLAGYAWQGRPDLPAAISQKTAENRDAAAALITLRSDMDQSFGVAKTWLVTADGFARSGSYQAAAGYIQAGIRQNPDNADLWSGLGLVLFLAADGEMTPAARLAFDKARTLSPNRPAPDYFEGLASLFDRKPAETIVKWRGILANATPKAKWRPAVEAQLQGLESLLTQPTPAPVDQ